MTQYGMFTKEGDALVHRIAVAGRELADVDGPVNPVTLACQWALRELEKLAHAEGYEEAYDTSVREAVVGHILVTD